MDPTKLKAAIEALKNNDGDAALAILEELLVGNAAGEPEADPASDPSAVPADPMAAAASRALLDGLCALTGAKAPGEILAACTRMASRIAEQDASHAAIELSSRRELIAKLIDIGVETPALAWQGAPEDRNPCARLSAESVDSLRHRVALLSQTHKSISQGNDPPPTALTAEEEKLTAKMTRDQKERFVALRNSRRAR